MNTVEERAIENMLLVTIRNWAPIGELDSPDHQQLRNEWIKEMLPEFSSLLASSREAKWISVEERLPAMKEWVWVWHPLSYGTKGCYIGSNQHGQMWLYGSDPMGTFNKPSYWMPLPSPPVITRKSIS